MKDIIIGIGIIVIGISINAQNCPAYFSYAESAEYKAENYAPLYEKWKKAFDDCVDTQFGKNILIDAEYIVTKALDTTPEEGPKREDMKTYLVKVLDKNIQKYPKDANYYAAQKVSYLRYYKIGNNAEWLSAYDKAFSGDASDLPSSAMSDYYYLGQVMLEAKEISFDKMLAIYNSTKKALDKNIERSNIEISNLEKLDSLGTISKQQKASLKQKTEQRLAYTDSYNYVEGSVGSLYTCDRLIPLYKEQYTSKQNDINWLNEVRGALLYNECSDDATFADQVENQFAKLYCEQNPNRCKSSVSEGASTGGQSQVAANDYSTGLRMVQRKQYGKAASLLSKVADDSNYSSTDRSKAAYYAAYAYLQTGSLGSARSLANKAASLRGGWGDPYLIIASAYAKGANSCGSTLFEKKAAYWFAADVARKAARVDPRVSSKANSAATGFEKGAPSKADMFKAGVRPGQSVKTCYGTTKAR
ncbi:MAG: hypothetical protein ACK5MD_00245 [Flavobacteriales bacterium]